METKTQTPTKEQKSTIGRGIFFILLPFILFFGGIFTGTALAMYFFTNKHLDQELGEFIIKGCLAITYFGFIGFFICIPLGIYYLVKKKK